MFQLQKLQIALGLLLATMLVPLFSNSSGSVISAMPASMPRDAYTLYCASNDFDRQFCRVDIYGGVELMRVRSEAPCIYGRTWGLSNDAVWVDRGCRADFIVGTSGWSHREGYRQDHVGRFRSGQILYCASDDFDVHGCPAETYFGVRIVRQRSKAPCIYGRTWGYDERGIWVDRGCRADFAVGLRQSYRHYDGSSDDYNW